MNILRKRGVTHIHNLLHKSSIKHMNHRVGIYVDELQKDSEHEDILHESKAKGLICHVGGSIDSENYKTFVSRLLEDSVHINPQDDSKYLVMMVECDVASYNTIKYILPRYMYRDSHLILCVRHMLVRGDSIDMKEVKIRSIIYDIMRIYNTKSNSIEVYDVCTADDNVYICIGISYNRSLSYLNYTSYGYTFKMNDVYKYVSNVEHKSESIDVHTMNLNDKNMMRSMFQKMRIDDMIPINIYNSDNITIYHSIYALPSLSINHMDK